MKPQPDMLLRKTITEKQARAIAILAKRGPMTAGEFAAMHIGGGVNNRFDGAGGRRHAQVGASILGRLASAYLVESWFNPMAQVWFYKITEIGRVELSRYTAQHGPPRLPLFR